MNAANSRLIIRSLLVAAGFFATSIGMPTEAATHRTVALSGQQAPGAAPGVVFSDFIMDQYSGPGLNNLGRTAFMATLAEGGVDASNDRGIWSEGAGPLTLEAREGSQAPSTPAGAVFSFLNDPQLNDAGQIAFHGYLASGPGGVTSANDNGIWFGNSGSVQNVARTGDASPGAPPGYAFTGFTSYITLNESGEIAFQGGTTNAAGGIGGIWSGVGGALELVVRSGDQAPGTPAGTTFYGINPPSLSDSGKIAFFADLRDSTGVSPTPIIPTGIWAGEAGSISLVIRPGDQAPGLPPGAQLDGFYSGPNLNAAGQVLVHAYLKPGSGGVTVPDSAAIFSDRAGSLDLILQSNTHPPGTPAGARFSRFVNPVINDAGEIAFQGVLREGFGDVGMSTENSSGIWSEGGGSLQLVARAGSHAPGTPLDAVFNSFSVTAPVLNAAGQLAFEADLKQGVGGVDPTNDGGIWAEDRTGILRLIVREGNKLDVDDGPGIDRRTVTDLEFLSWTGNGDGRASGFNDLGQLAFRAVFTDGSEGVFVSDLATIPEPASLLQALPALLSALALRRRS